MEQTPSNPSSRSTVDGTHDIGPDKRCPSCECPFSGITTNYDYIALPDDRIRAFYIHPATNFRDPICCDFDLIRMEGPDILPYMTLSYAWGQTFPDGSHLTDTIYCDGERLSVTSSLNQTLKRIRQHWQHFQSKMFASPKCGYPLWVDAVCINQRDPAERGRLVNQMGDIFRCSSQLLVSFGELSDFEATELAQRTRRFNSLEDELRNHPGLSKRFMQSLLARSWFSRRWVVQEWMLSPENDRTFLLGKHVFSSAALYCSLSWNKMKEWPKLLYALMQRSESLLATLHDYNRSECHDPRDRIYALLQLPTKIEIDLRADYKISVTQLYKNLAVQIMKSNDSIRLRCHLLAAATCHRSETFQYSPDLPSWVPDWRHPCRYRSKLQQIALERTLEESSMGKIFLDARFPGNTLEIEGTLEIPCVEPCRGRKRATCFSCHALNTAAVKEWSKALQDQIQDIVDRGDFLFWPMSTMSSNARNSSICMGFACILENVVTSLNYAGGSQLYRLRSCISTDVPPYETTREWDVAKKCVAIRIV